MDRKQLKLKLLGVFNESWEKKKRSKTLLLKYFASTWE